MIRKVLLTVFALLICIGNVSAQEAQLITLQEAVDIALKNNFQLKMAQNNLTLAEAGVTNEMADFLPSISASLGGRSNSGQQANIQGDSIIFGNYTSKNINGSISTSITLFDGFNNINSLRLSQQQKISREENLQRARENVIFITASRYLQVLLDRELLEIAEENLATSQKQLEQVSAQVEVGARASVDLYEQEALVANNELNVTVQRNNLKFSELSLIRQLQIDPLGSYQFVTPEYDEEQQMFEIRSYNLSELIDEALYNRSDIRAEMANIKSLDYQVKLAQGNLYPSLSASASISTGYSDPYFLANSSFSDQFFDMEINKSIGFSLSLPIFQNWDRMYNIQQAKIQRKNAELALEDTKLQVIQEVAQAYNDYISYTQQLTAAEKAQIATERAFETQQARYNVGSSTFVELSQAQANYVEAQSDYTSALYNLIFQEKLLDYYLGKLNGSSVEF